MPKYIQRYKMRIIGSLTLCSLLLPGAILADPTKNNSVAISPVSQEISLNAGESYTGRMIVDTLGDVPIAVKIYPTSYGVEGEDYAQKYAAPTKGVDASKWVHPVLGGFQNITRGHIASAQYTVTVPNNTEPGGYYAVLFAQLVPADQGTAGSSVQNQARAGTILYIRVKGALKEGGSIASWKVSNWQIKSPLHTELRMKNEGNVHFRAVYNVRISDYFGNQKALIGNSRVILPNTTLRIPVDWDQAPAFGLFKVGGTVEYLGKTEPLPVHYVLMMSSWAFVVLAILIVVLVLYARFGRAKNVSRKRRK